LGALLVRMGMHMGEPDCRPHPTTGAMDYYGPMVNRAARINGAAYGGQVLASSAIVKAIRTDRVSVAKLGNFMLKGLSEPEELHEIRVPELPREHKSPRAERVASTGSVGVPPV
jgi:class 3 adenylate cyclase